MWNLNRMRIGKNSVFEKIISILDFAIFVGYNVRQCKSDEDVLVESCNPTERENHRLEVLSGADMI